MEIHFRIIGYLLASLALVHIIFPRYFNWKEQLNSLTLINRQMVQVHTFFIAFTVFAMGVLCITSYADLIGTKLGKHICFGLGVFWTIRLFVQLFVYSPKLWKGKTFETIVHILFSLFWTYMGVVFLWTALN